MWVGEWPLDPSYDLPVGCVYPALGHGLLGEPAECDTGLLEGAEVEDIYAGQVSVDLQIGSDVSTCGPLATR